jgi:hypothetical protein
MGSERAEALAERFEEANRALRVAITAATDEQLRTTCRGERCTMVALACHVANVHSVGRDLVSTLATGQSLPRVTMEDVDRANAEGFARDAGCTREEALHRLAANGEEAAETVRGLTDEQLDRAGPFALFGGATVSVQTLIEQILIGDPLGHLPSIEAAIGTKPEVTLARRTVAQPNAPTPSEVGHTSSAVRHVNQSLGH